MTYKIVDLTQRSPQWKDWRSWKIGASYAPTLMYANPYESPMQLYDRIIGVKEIEVNGDMQRGVDLEDSIREKVGILFQAEYKPICVESTTHPFMIASLDGWGESSHHECDWHGIEIKAPRKFSAFPTFFSCPNKYYAQLQHCMAVTGEKNWCYIESVNNEVQWVCVMRDELFIQELIEKEKEFYNCLMNFSPPESFIEDWRIN